MHEPIFGDAAVDLVDHHNNAHTPTKDCVRIATEAGAKALALHHLVPGTSPRETWLRGAKDFDGTYLVEDDLDEISFRPKCRSGSVTSWRIIRRVRRRGCLP
jgi:ribonuclease BN (tRNA processing enzyme)